MSMDAMQFEKRDVPLEDVQKVEDEARAFFKEHFGEEPFVFKPTWYSTGSRWRLSATANSLCSTVESGDPLPLSDRRKYWATIHALLGYLDKHGSLTAAELAAIEKLKEEHAWDGLSCACGGGWLIGHASGCPEAKAS